MGVCVCVAFKYENCLVQMLEIWYVALPSFTSDGYDLKFFTVANRGYFYNLGLSFFPRGLECTVRV